MPPLHSLVIAITDLGESSVLLSTVIAACGWFWLNHQRHLAHLWLLAAGGCAVTMLVLKLGFLSCGQFVPGAMVLTPSGHSAMSALFYGAAALTIGKLSARAARHPLLLRSIGLALPLAIGATRVVVHAHTPQEVAIGLAVGFAWRILFARQLPTTEASAPQPPAAVLGLLGLLYGGLLAVTMTGEHMTVESLLYRVADAVHVHWGVCTGG